MSRSLRLGLALLLWGVSVVAFVSAQRAPETFTATASARQGEARLTVPLTVTVTRYASEETRATVMAAIRAGGTAGLRKALTSMEDAGFVQVGERRTAIKFAGDRPTASGRLITVATAEPILFLGAGIPGSRPAAGSEVAVALLEVRDGGNGIGELAPAAQVGLSKDGALVIEDYGSTVVWLSDLGVKR